ncbi:MAG TPA: amidophosphoribosyltransferase [Polyangiaceae bacterium LLY-WYZ-15_(1-7)]|nr:amidophosphoribosyltransferase [Sandaracinus sp.]HJK91490.1 amidophosphoribosyltransferase [Polyangiaceae bacterium LLY-WYZ-15_(1-7)]MBJ73142.1 amidophosphoribosyltransferase [Sandaracinus sp.]HJL05152.1 amidophosphoribosyltransferase [Polyangiaceae bacterium LLY-WYZ-15_(1-7)]HJL13003.1 amidophosphoribosyltransferase [Polyangiaceae bacterium LLY-WYZ-15_(1-7)]
MCGFVGLVASQDVAPQIHLALQALQHRGQDSAGIATMSGDGRRFAFRRGLGTVVNALDQADLEALPGAVGLGHVRYPTIGRGVLEDAQPFFYRQPGVLMAHNGNVTNVGALERELAKKSIHLMSRCDVEPALCVFADALMGQRPADHTTADALEALRAVQRSVRGSYSIVAALRLDGRPTLLVFRDPHGIRPATLGRRDDGAWMAASESVCLDATGFSHAFEPRPGEAVILRAGEEPERHALEARTPSPCIFEAIYFARPDAVMGDRSVYEVRLDLGRQLASRLAAKGVSADVVFPVPDTARPAATAVAEELALPLREGFIKNRYSGRTFIMPDALTRDQALRLKLNPIPREIAGKRVLLVDDSIVRGTTLRRVVGLLEAAGAAEVHLAIHAPPVSHPCFYGIDMSTEDELFARRFVQGTPDGEAGYQALERDAAAALGADSLTWLRVADMDAAAPGPRCAACFDGVYPEPVPDVDRDEIVRDRQA